MSVEERMVSFMATPEQVERLARRASWIAKSEHDSSWQLIADGLMGHLTYVVQEDEPWQPTRTEWA